MTTPTPYVVLAVEDDPQMSKFLRTSLTAEGYKVLSASTAAEALTLARTNNPDLVLLDLGLPDTDGMVVTKNLREWSTTPILVISARGQEDDKVRALDAGADDYLTKPFGVSELMARIRVALRHKERGSLERPDPVIVVGDLEIDLDKRAVRVAGVDVHLTPHEYKLFAILMKNAGKVLTHRQLLEHVWGAAYSSQNHYLRVYMTRLRHKLEVDVTRPRYLLSEAGVGYRLRES